jgi:hypothetical protein
MSLSFAAIAMSCGNNGASQGASTPIDTTNVKSTAPASYGGNNPANDTASKNNTNDTGTKANNIHNEGTR